jgi:DNA-binding NtrC family response regulator
MGKAKVVFVAASERASKCLFSPQHIGRFDFEAAVADRQTVEWAQAATWDVVCLEQHEDAGRTWRDDVKQLRRVNQAVPIILLACPGSEHLAVEALRLGLRDYVSEPWSEEAVLTAVRRCLLKQGTSTNAPEHDRSQLRGNRIVGSNASILKLKANLARVACADSTVLISGETGTGKELAAEFIHENSSRRDKPFVCINCAAIPDALLESELFGHTKGAFTGAEGLRDGLLAGANGGTIFLDEIGDMSLFAQAKILRVLETKEVFRLGATRRTQLNVRFVAATNRDLEGMTNSGAFRKDLYFRLNVVPIQLLPLRERPDDIPVLVEHYCRAFCEKKGGAPPRFSEECLNCFLRYNWPGNIRELKNVLESLFLGKIPVLFCLEHLPERIRAIVRERSHLSSTERDLLITVLSSEGWNKSKAAAKLNWSRMTLYRKIAKYRISRCTSRSEIALDRSPAKAPATQPV